MKIYLLFRFFVFVCAQKVIASELPSIEKLYAGHSESMLACKRLANISAQNNHIVIVDIGCAVGEFVDSFHKLNNKPQLGCLAIGADPLIEKYKERKMFLDPSLYKGLYQTVICEAEEMVDVFVNDSLLDLSSVKHINFDVVDELPQIYDLVKQACHHSPTYKLPCKAMTLDGLCREAGVQRIDLLKLDTQGNEYEILHSISRELFKNIAIIYVETPVPRKKGLYHDQASFEKIYQLMVENNFKLIGVYGLDDSITLEDSIDLNCIFINEFGPTIENLSITSQIKHEDA